MADAYAALGSPLSPATVTPARRGTFGHTIKSHGVAFRLSDRFHREFGLQQPGLLNIALILLGTSAAFVAIAVDWGAKELLLLRRGSCDESMNAATTWIANTVWVGSASVLALGAAALVRLVPDAAGSGIPEVRETFSGVVRDQSFAPQVLAVKAGSVALALASSLSIGKEGPLVHIACCCAEVVGWLPFGERWQRRRDERRTEMLTAACAVGVVLTFGAPVGGILFSIEMTTSHYLLANLPRAALTVTVALIIVHQGLLPLLLGTPARSNPSAWHSAA